VSDGTAGLSPDEHDKIAAYHKAMTDRQSGAVKVADRVPPDAGMAATGEMPSAAMRADRPMASSALSSQAQGDMPRPAMNPGMEAAPEAATAEMPRPPMNQA
jgi:hypothetical protein